MEWIDQIPETWIRVGQLFTLAVAILAGLLYLVTLAWSAVKRTRKAAREAAEALGLDDD